MHKNLQINHKLTEIEWTAFLNKFYSEMTISVKDVVHKASTGCSWSMSISSLSIRSLYLFSLPPPFLHSSHLQFSPHLSPAWKHSQYFLRQNDFLQLQPLRCLSSLIFWLKGSGFLSMRTIIALLLSSAYYSKLWHPTQLQPSHVWLILKQSQ